MHQHDLREQPVNRLVRRRERGQSLVEFALVLPLFLLLFFAIVDFGSAVFTYNSLTNAAREGARLAIVNQDSASIVAKAKAQVSVAEVADPSVTIAFFDANADGSASGTSCSTAPTYFGCVAVVQFESTYRPLTPIIGNIVFKNGVTLKAKAEVTVEYDCPNATHTSAQCPKQP
jgi:Flp pilus assembly protein TadG